MYEQYRHQKYKYCFEVRHPRCDTNIIKLIKNSNQNTTKGILAKDGVGLSELHVSAFYSGHHQVKSLIIRSIEI